MSDKIERINLKEIKNPSFLKRLNYDSLYMLCQDIREEIIDTCSKYGGHLSSNLGVVELTVALHRCFDFSKDKLIFDVGHQCYTHKILTGRSLENIKHRGYVSGFQKISESNYDVYEAGHSSTSISAVQGFALARDLKKENFDVIALIGDSSIVNGLAFEALNSISETHSKVIIVLNDNGMSISKPVGGISRFFRKVSMGKVYNSFKRGYKRALYRGPAGKKLASFSSNFKNALKRRLVPITMFENMGFSYFGPFDGHNVKELEKALNRAKKLDKSVVIHVKTIKGKGYHYAERDSSGYWHGVTPFDKETGRPLKYHPGMISWSHYFSDLTRSMLKQYPNSYLIVPATLKGSGLGQCFQEFPDKCIDVGIAEEHALTLASAMALNDIHPIVSIYSTFLQRAYDELAHDCARLYSNMTLLIDRAGLVGLDGETHQGIYDEAFIKSIPNVILTMPSTKSIAYSLYHQSFAHHGVFAIRYPRDFVDERIDHEPVSLPFLRWKWANVTEKKDLAILAVGPHGKEVERLLKKKKIEAEVIDPIYLFPILKDNLILLTKYSNILIYDAYGTRNGFAESIMAELMLLNYKGKLYFRTVPNLFISQGTILEQEQEYGLTPEQIVDQAKLILNSIKK